jgi:2-methylisocitrate lyase-like PEP mutase family enzyme
MAEIDAHCETLRSLHIPGEPLLLPNAWDVASARAVEAAGFPVVATTSAGIAAALGYEDHEGAPGEEMLAAAARIAGTVAVPVTVDAESGYGMEPGELVAALHEIGVAGCNLEDTDHTTGELRDADEQAEWLAAVRAAAAELDYGLVINARIDVFLRGIASAQGDGSQSGPLEDGLERARAYSEAGADCVYPILLWEREPLGRFVAEHPGPVNAVRFPRGLSIAELAELGVARVSWGGQLAHRSIEWLNETLGSLAES